MRTALVTGAAPSRNGFFGINPSTLEACFPDDGPVAHTRYITRAAISHLPVAPATAALEWLWERWTAIQRDGTPAARRPRRLLSNDSRSAFTEACSVRLEAHSQKTAGALEVIKSLPLRF